MNNGYVEGVVGYRFTDGVQLMNYAQDNAEAFMPIDRDNDDDNIGGVGEWLGVKQTIELMPIAVTNDPEEYSKQFSALLYAASTLEDITPDNSLMVYINLIRLISPGKRAAITAMYTQKGYEIKVMSDFEYRCWLNSLGIKITRITEADIIRYNVDPQLIEVLRNLEENNPNILDDDNLDSSEFNQNIPGPVLKTVIGIYFNLITKKLTDDN